MCECEDDGISEVAKATDRAIDLELRATAWAHEVAEDMPRSDETALEEYLVSKLLEFISNNTPESIH